MAFNFGQYSGGFGEDDNYMSAFGDNTESIRSLFGNNDTYKALESSRRNRQQGMAGMATDVVQQIGQRQQALAYAKGWKKQVNEERRAQQSRQRRGFLGGALNLLGTAANYIPVAGPAIGAGLRVASELFS